MEKEKNNIQLAQRYAINKDSLKGSTFYGVPNVYGRNVLIIKTKDSITMSLPKYNLIIKDKIVSVDCKTNEDENTINKDSIAVNVKFGDKTIDCTFDQLVPIINELNEFFMVDIIYQGKIVYNEESNTFWFLIYDLITKSEYENKQGITPYIDRRELLDKINTFHTFVNISVAPTFYCGKDINRCKEMYNNFNDIIKNIGYIITDGFLIYKNDSYYNFGPTKDVLIHFNEV